MTVGPQLTDLIAHLNKQREKADKVKEALKVLNAAVEDARTAGVQVDCSYGAAVWAVSGPSGNPAPMQIPAQFWAYTSVRI